jgi:hypothetical protein
MFFHRLGDLLPNGIIASQRISIANNEDHRLIS